MKVNRSVKADAKRFRYLLERAAIKDSPYEDDQSVLVQIYWEAVAPQYEGWRNAALLILDQEMAAEDVAS